MLYLRQQPHQYMAARNNSGVSYHCHYPWFALMITHELTIFWTKFLHNVLMLVNPSLNPHGHKSWEAMSRYIIQTFYSWSDIHLQFVPDEVIWSGPESYMWK